MIDVEAWTRSVKLQHLRAILAIAETTSMALAAERLKLTQPAVTKILHEIEEDLGVQLCTRTSRGTHLTPSGRILADHVTLIFSQLGQAAKAIHDNREGLSGRVVVGTLIAGAASLLPSAIARLQSERPGVRVTIIEGTYDYLTPLLRQGALDLIVGRLPKQEYRDGLEEDALYQERIAIVVRPGHPALALKRPGLGDLRRWPWILPLSGTSLRLLLEAAFHDRGLELPEERCESVSVVSNRRLIMETDYICSFPWEVVKLDVEHGMLCRIDASMPFMFGPVGISRRKGGGLSRAAEALVEALRSAAALNHPV